MMTPPEVIIKYRPHPAARIAETRRVDGHHPQEAFHRDRYRIRYRALLAGTGGGKTAAAAFEAVSWALENPGSVGLLGQPNYPMILRNLTEPGGALHELLGPLSISPIVRRYNKQEHIIEYRNGSIQWLVTLDDPENVEGTNVDYVWVDEIRLVRHWRRAWSALKRRLRGSRPGARTGAWVTTHSPTAEQVEELENPLSEPGQYRVYRWSTLDNPLLSEAYVREIERSHTGSAYRAVVLGEAARPEGLVYSNYQRARNVRPAQPTQAWQRMTYGVDWGWTLPAAISAIQWSGETAHVVEEVYGSHIDPDELVLEALRLVQKWGRGKFWTGADKPEHTRKLVTAGLEAEPYVGKVADGTMILNGMLGGAELLFDPSCVNHLREIDLYAMRPDSDEPEKGHDHALDSARYAVMGGRSGRKRKLLSRS